MSSLFLSLARSFRPRGLAAALSAVVMLGLFVAALPTIPGEAGSRADAAPPIPEPLYFDDSPLLVDGPPFSMPFIEPPGPNTWLYWQHYGNTPTAYNFGDDWYASGQGMHFGLDLYAPCGTAIHAIADGIVTYVDGPGFGAGPHNLVLTHPDTNYSSLYGHMRDVPLFVRGDAVERGQFLGVSGDPDGSCGSRPHLHLEIRSTDYLTAYNPVNFFDANWHMIASIGPQLHTFQQDLANAHQWMTIEDQLDVRFSTNIANNYLKTWPPPRELAPPPMPRPAFEAPPVGPETPVLQEIVNAYEWNIGPWWDPGDPDAVYLIDDAPTGGSGGVYRQPLNGGPRRLIRPGPPALISGNGNLTMELANFDYMRIIRRTDGMVWDINTSGHYGAISPDGQRLLWRIVYGEISPGSASGNPGVQVWASKLDGSDARLLYSYAGSEAQWIDNHRVLITRRVQYTTETLMFIIDLNDPALTPQSFGSFNELRDLQISPGGDWMAYTLVFQADPARSGMYIQPTTLGSQPRQVDFFGAFQWRDSDSLFTLSFEPERETHTLGVIDANTGEYTPITDPEQTPIRVANGDWAVAPDGMRIIYVDPHGYTLNLLTLVPRPDEEVASEDVGG